MLYPIDSLSEFMSGVQGMFCACLFIFQSMALEKMVFTIMRLNLNSLPGLKRII